MKPYLSFNELLVLIHFLVISSDPKKNKKRYILFHFSVEISLINIATANLFLTFKCNNFNGLIAGTMFEKYLRSYRVQRT